MLGSRQVRALAIPAFMGLFLIACGSGGEEPAETSAPSSRIAQADLDFLLKQSNPFVTDIIEDGEVTAAEYESAVLRTIQCYDENNVIHSEPYYQEMRFGEGRWEYTIQQNPSTESARIDCFESFEYPVLSVWAYQFKWTESQQMEVDQDLVSCANDAGIDGSSRVEIEAAVEDGGLGPDAMHQYTRCLVLAERGYDIDVPPDER